MTELGAKAWRGYSPIDWQRLARAHAFFERKGYQYVEVPWAVPEEIVNITLPPGNTPIAVRGADAVLVGSAEQGFLDIVKYATYSLWQEGLYFSISPCFRGEPEIYRGHTQLTFMKLELFAPNALKSQILLEDAEQFMASEGAQLVRVNTEHGIDLECAGIEVGSYGVREHHIKWSYATGLAEPRFSHALQLQEED